jgi:hypothetical protein
MHDIFDSANHVYLKRKKDRSYSSLDHLISLRRFLFFNFSYIFYCIFNIESAHVNICKYLARHSFSFRDIKLDRLKK